MIPYRQMLIAAAMGFAMLLVRTAHADDDESADDDDEAPADSAEEGASDDTAEGNARDESEESEPESEPPEKETPTSEEPPPAPARGWARLWLGIAGTLDFVPMPSGTDLCMLSNNGVPLNNVGVYCTNPDGSDFPPRSGPALVTGDAGRLDGGFTDGNLRILFSADYAPTPSLLIGIRAGYAFNGYPGGAVDQGFPEIDRHLHAELRVTYLFGKDPMTRVGFAPMVFLAGGASEFAAYVTRFVNLEGRGDQPVNIWVVRGPWFVTAGAGVRYQFSPRVAFNAALRLNAVFGEPSVLFTTGPDLGVAYGF
jgi:hypothetical protein